MNVNEIVTVAQNLPFEQRKELIRALFIQSPKTEPLAGSITLNGDLESASRQVREQVNRSLQQTVRQLIEPEAEP